ncbi:hypothetical protein ACFQ88_23180 [Paenibacillus sp. NPDC056579]|uniref:hypothetical protein n=1 Tax=Paenibacillus sp. NPDC056579 TaxID=3345871 RepID=UPI00368E9AE4
MSTNGKWSFPQEVTDVDIAFGGRTHELLPDPEEIPEEFWNEDTKWHKLASDIFFGRELSGDIHEREGIDVHFAARHIKAVLASYQPKHQHKIAGCAFLMSQFYRDVTY